MTGPLDFGIVGAGAIAQAYSQAFSGFAAARVAAVADPRAEAAAALAEQLGGAAFAGHREMLERARLDAVLVCTPPASHAEIGLDCLERRVAVLCEKPLALDAGAARCMVAAAERAGVALTMASKFRYVE
ncbi:MAG TPA: Gfo/Idh/MocA family oxidoreductase, partial [Thermoanaerobaculia bacterium]|nr:Gfo/Idh/MocA family oxidoreductase [Thermoanaerobaculia bacterium]